MERVWWVLKSKDRSGSLVKLIRLLPETVSTLNDFCTFVVYLVFLSNITKLDAEKIFEQTLCVWLILYRVFQKLDKFYPMYPLDE